MLKGAFAGLRASPYTLKQERLCFLNRFLQILMWLKLHTEIIDDPKLADLSGDAFRIWIYLMALLKQQNGTSNESNQICLDQKKMAWKFRISMKKLQNFLGIFEKLQMICIEKETGFISILNWRKRQFCESLERVRKFRQRYRNGYSNSNVTPSVTIDTDTDTDKEKDKERERDASAILKILEYLNQKAGTSFRLKTKTRANLKFIRERLTEGFTPDDLKMVIDFKVAQWKNDPERHENLNPMTLFRPANFERYLQAARKSVGQPKSELDEALGL